MKSDAGVETFGLMRRLRAVAAGRYFSGVLASSFFARPTETVARSLIGCRLRRRIGDQWLGGIIVETEAYLSGERDAASHSAAGRTRRNRSMFGRPGTFYVYQIHTRHCLNIATDRVDIGAAVLIRAIEPVWGVDEIRLRRGVKDHTRLADQRRLTTGPGMLCDALKIDLDVDGEFAPRHSTLRLECPPASLDQSGIDVVESSRIGISRSTDRPLRFFVRGNRFVSGPAAVHGVPRRGRLFPPSD